MRLNGAFPISAFRLHLLGRSVSAAGLSPRPSALASLCVGQLARDHHLETEVSAEFFGAVTLETIGSGLLHAMPRLIKSL
jgi:hypothetical protein